MDIEFKLLGAFGHVVVSEVVCYNFIMLLC